MSVVQITSPENKDNESPSNIVVTSTEIKGQDDKVKRALDVNIAKNAVNERQTDILLSILTEIEKMNYHLGLITNVSPEDL